MDPLVADELCDGLLLMPSLESLMIRLPDDCPVSILEAINSTLAHCTFSLNTLHISEHVILLPWILNQTEIETIAVETSGETIWGFDGEKHLSCQQLLSGSPRHPNPPTFFILCENAVENSIAAFPTFSAGWSARPIKRSLEGNMISSFREITLFCLYVRTLDELENSLSAIESIPCHFMQFFSLQLCVGDGVIHLNPKAVASALSYFSGLVHELEVQTWESPLKDKPMADSYKDQKLELAKAWSEQCPSLVFITFPDGDCRGRAEGWTPFEEETREIN